MKTLLLVRHAKSSWDNYGISDHDRPLDKRGLRDAPFMANLIKEKGIVPELLLSSTAERAMMTAKFFADVFDLPHADIDSRNSLYLCWVDDLDSAIRALPDDLDTVFVFNHNPTLEYLAGEYSKGNIDRFPTCAIGHFQADVQSWGDFTASQIQTLGYYFPKQFFQ